MAGCLSLSLSPLLSLWSGSVCCPPPPLILRFSYTPHPMPHAPCSEYCGVVCAGSAHFIVSASPPSGNPYRVCMCERERPSSSIIHLKELPADAKVVCPRISRAEERGPPPVTHFPFLSSSSSSSFSFSYLPSTFATFLLPTPSRSERERSPCLSAVRDMSELAKKSSGTAETACCGSMGNGKAKGAELVGIKGGAATAAPACDGSTAAQQGETTREC